jgi:hypothetical protein
MRHLTFSALMVGAQIASSLGASGQAILPNGLPNTNIGPPINPQDVFRAQPQPMTTAPSATATPPIAPLSTPPRVGPSVPASGSWSTTIEIREHSAHCRDAAEDVPRRKRARYIRRCMKQH